MRKFIIYGAGERGRQIYKIFFHAKLDQYIYAFCDKNYKEIDLPWENIKVLPYDFLKNDMYVYIVSPLESMDIVDLLKKDNQEYYVDLKDCVDKYFKNNKKINLFSSSKPFILDESNELLEDYFNNNNYKIIDHDESKEYCYIFFSSNALYYPNSEGCFCTSIIGCDYYEWESLVKKSVPCKAAKSIYVRDIRKMWYITGINNKICSIDELTKFLRKITKGYKIITVGSSAGGYAASIIGVKLEAELIYNFSGQFSLYEPEELIGNCYWLNKYSNIEQTNIYFNICRFIKDNKARIIYFYPQYVEQDIIQSNLVKEYNNVYSIPVASFHHGETISNEEKVNILNKTFDEIKELYPCE